MSLAEIRAALAPQAVSLRGVLDALEAAKRPVSLDALLCDVWGGWGSPATVRNTIMRLRRRGVPIETVHGGLCTRYRLAGIGGDR